VFGPFAASRRLTAAGDVVAVATPGHTADHVSVVVEDQETTYFLAGATLRAISQFAKDRPTVYLPTHDPESAVRLAGRRLTVAGP
jgi:glyoxylase-like metal-dependent hydrolase (beta-lactamase superfamily II)